MVYRSNLTNVLDLVVIQRSGKASEDEEILDWHIRSIHKEVWKKTEGSNAKYMEAADRGCRLLVFYVEDYVWMFLRWERISAGAFDKLIGQKIGECKVIGKIN